MEELGKLWVQELLDACDDMSIVLAPEVDVTDPFTEMHVVYMCSIATHDNLWSKSTRMMHTAYGHTIERMRTRSSVCSHACRDMHMHTRYGNKRARQVVEAGNEGFRVEG